MSSVAFEGDPDLVTLAEAKAWLREQLDEGVRCPCCTQFAKVYRRKLTRASARAILALYQEGRKDWVHLPVCVKRRLPDVAHQGGYMTLGGYWRLIEEERTLREDGGRAGFWRVTDLGFEWLLGSTTVPKYVLLYDGRVLGQIGEPVTVSSVLGERFDLRELMDGL